MVEPFERKLQFLAKQVMWFGAMILMLPLCMWGMFLGWEYRNDECVNKNFYYILLDGWLFCVSIYNLFCAVGENHDLETEQFLKSTFSHHAFTLLSC